jgi:hypothetical protein
MILILETQDELEAVENPILDVTELPSIVYANGLSRLITVFPEGLVSDQG